MSPLVSINLVVRNGEKYIKECLEAVFNQTYPHLEVVVFDNASEDNTLKIIQKEFPQAKIIRNSVNYGFGGGQNRCLGLTKGRYVLPLCVDVILDKNFIKKGVELMEKDSRIGGLQPKIYWYDFDHRRKTDFIDTTGFIMFKSRRLINRGHGEKDKGQYDQIEEIFAYEGAAPFLRRKALKEAEINGEVWDEDLFWYATDIDVAWRIRLFGWKIFYYPKMVAYHDRPTTQRLSRNWFDFIKIRKNIPAFKRKLDYRNQRLVMVKNEIISLYWLRDIWYFFQREIPLLLYFLFFEPTTLKAIPEFFILLPKILKKRKIIMKKRKIKAKEIEKWLK